MHLLCRVGHARCQRRTQRAPAAGGGVDGTVRQGCTVQHEVHQCDRTPDLSSSKPSQTPDQACTLVATAARTATPTTHQHTCLHSGGRLKKSLMQAVSRACGVGAAQQGRHEARRRSAASVPVLPGRAWQWCSGFRVYRTPQHAGGTAHQLAAARLPAGYRTLTNFTGGSSSPNSSVNSSST